MHLKLQIHLTGGSPIRLLALVQLASIVGILVGLKSGVFAQEAQQRALSNQDGPASFKETTHERKCEPMLNIVLPQRPHTMTTRAAIEGDQEEVTIKTHAPRGLPKSFAFAIDNIDMPLAQTGSPVQSVMRLLSAFDGQLDGGGDDDDDQSDQVDANGEVPPRENSIRFVQNKLHISNLNLTMLNIHLYAEGQPKFGLGVNIGNATLAGRFAYNGPMPSLMGGDFMSKLAGHYRMSIDNVLVAATSNLTKQHFNVTGQQALLPYRLATSDLRMNISNLGYISIDILDASDSSKPTSNYVLKMLQRVLQKTIKRTYNKFEEYIRQTLEVEGRRFLDCELTRFSPILSENQAHDDVGDLLATSSSSKNDNKTTNNLDDLARILSSEIRNTRLDRVGLANFEYQRSVLGTNALIVFTNGSLSGLDNLRLLGETRVKLQDEHLIANASLGWYNLKPSYNWTLYLGNSAQAAHLLESLNRQDQSASKAATARGFVSATIKAIEFDTLISYRAMRFTTNQSSSQQQNRVSVEELNIRRLDGPKMDIGGLPGMNRLTRATVNFFMGRLKQRLVSSIQPSLKLELERALNRLAP